MVAPSALTEEDLSRFLEKHGNNRVKRELLLFWAMHPKARFSQLAICCALECNKPAVKVALKTLVKEGLLDTRSHNNVTLYSLTTNEKRRQPVLGLVALGWGRRKLMLRCTNNKEAQT